LPIPGGGGACLATDGAEASLSMACCGGAGFCEVAVFDMISKPGLLMLQARGTGLNYLR